jgi:hypothetical protein
VSSSHSSSNVEVSTKIEWGFLRKLFFSNVGYRVVTVPLIFGLLVYLGTSPLLTTFSDRLSVANVSNDIQGLSLYNDDALHKSIGDAMVVSLKSATPFTVIVDRQEAPVAAVKKFDRRYYVEDLSVEKSEGIRIAGATNPVEIIHIHGNGVVTAESTHGFMLGYHDFFGMFAFMVSLVVLFSFFNYEAKQ